MSVDPWRFESPYESTDRRPRFHAGELMSQAEMCAAAERLVRDIVPHDVKTVRIGKLRGIAIGGAEHRPQHGVTRKLAPADFIILGQDAPVEEDRRVVTQAFLDRVVDEFGTFPQDPHLVGMLDEGP